MSEENRNFDLRAAYQNLLDEVPSAEDLREKGMEEKAAEYMAKVQRVVMECIGKVLEECPGNEEQAMFTLNTLAITCHQLDSLSVSVREDGIMQMHRDEDELDKLM